jgi:hypothetical protein
MMRDTQSKGANEMANEIKEIRRYMKANLEDSRFDGEINMTHLAESCANDLDHSEWLDDETHIIWDVASEFYEL